MQASDKMKCMLKKDIKINKNLSGGFLKAR